jgi:subtilase family serine protease
LTAQVPGCTAEREFTGTLGQALNLTGGSTLRDCPGSPMGGYTSVTASQTSAPPPTSTSTSTSSTTSTSTSTITSTSTSTTTIPMFADLIPFDPSNSQFCRLAASTGNLLVQVWNQGAATAGAFQTQVTFSVSGKGVVVSASAPGLAPSHSTDLSFAIPSSCFSADCSFTIAVDSGNAVAESNESNNTASGRCIG